MKSKAQPLVSVVLPTHNRGSILRVSLSSVLAQTYENMEILLIDDASSDNTRNVVEGLNDNRVIYHRLKRNMGPGGARNVGISVAQGEFVFFQDSDDIWLPEKVERQLAAYYLFSEQKRNVVGGFCRFIKIGNRVTSVIPREENLHRFGGHFHEPLLRGNLIGTPTLMVESTVLRKIGGFDECLSTLEDWDLALRLSREGLLAFTNDILMCSLSSNAGVNSRPSGRSLLRLIKNNESSFRRHKRLHSMCLRSAALQFIKSGERDEGIATAKMAFRANWSLRGLAISACPSAYLTVRKLMLMGRNLMRERGRRKS